LPFIERMSLPEAQAFYTHSQAEMGLTIRHACE